MRKKAKQPKRKQNAKSAAAPKPAETSSSRRTFLRNGVIAVAVVTGGGWLATTAVRATMHEHDLSRVGNGTPAIVQIHDPQCQLCTTLQKETRRALDQFDDGAFEYVVANIKTPEGSAFANYHGVPHVTLLLFDGAGNLHQSLNGPRKRDELYEAFSVHLDAHG